jgi:hypothetical protein
MEWVIGGIILWIVWRLLTGKSRREATIKDAIHRAYVANTQLDREWISTPIYWEAAEKFSIDRGVSIYDAAAHFDMKVNGDVVSVILMRNRMNGTTDVSVSVK